VNGTTMARLLVCAVVVSVVAAGCPVDAIQLSCLGDGDCPSGYICSDQDMCAVAQAPADAGVADAVLVDASAVDLLRTDASAGDSSPLESSVSDTPLLDTSARDLGLLDTRASDSLLIDAGVPDARLSDTGVSDLRLPDSGVSDTRPPDTNARDTRLPDTSAPDTLLPDTLQPDTLLPDTLLPDSAAPDAGLCGAAICLPGEDCVSDGQGGYYCACAAELCGDGHCPLAGECCTDADCSAADNQRCVDHRCVVTERVEQVLQRGLNGYNGCADIWIDAYVPTYAYDGDAVLLFRHHGVDKRSALMRFDLAPIPDGVALISAELSIYFYANDGDDGIVLEAYQVSRSWNQGSCNWNNASAGVPWSSPGCNGVGVDRAGTPLDTVTMPGEIPITQRWESWDVTAAVQEWLAAPSTNHGIIIRAPSCCDLPHYFAYSCDWVVHPDRRPKLKLTYLQ